MIRDWFIGKTITDIEHRGDIVYLKLDNGRYIKFAAEAAVDLCPHCGSIEDGDVLAHMDVQLLFVQPGEE